MGEIRDKVYLAGHLGCADRDGQYAKTRDEKLSKEFLGQFYEKLETDYIDVLFYITVMMRRIWTKS